MINGVWGKKIGMTQVFSEDHKVIPVTVIDVSDWLITQIKTQENAGYNAVQVGYLRKKYKGQDFSAQWLKDLNKYFSVVKEVGLLNETHELQIGQVADVGQLLAQGDNVDISGITIGRGFQGVMHRHGHSGGRGSHGDKLGRAPGSLSFTRSQGRVFKGRRLPGHMGVAKRVMRNLKVVKIEPTSQVLLIKGSVPGKSGSLVFVKKCR
ncbi:MAG: 50S ribosomal protein L3 [Candidatus Babeliaceae bacterium]